MYLRLGHNVLTKRLSQLHRRGGTSRNQNTHSKWQDEQETDDDGRSVVSWTMRQMSVTCPSLPTVSAHACFDINGKIWNQHSGGSWPQHARIAPRTGLCEKNGGQHGTPLGGEHPCTAPPLSRSQSSSTIAHCMANANITTSSRSRQVDPHRLACPACRYHLGRKGW